MTKEDSDRVLFGNLVEEHQDYLYSFVLSMTGNPETAQDITAKAFLKAYLAFSKFKKNCSFKTWVTTVAINLIKNHRRDRKPISSIDDEFEETGIQPVDLDVTPSDSVVICENKSRMQKALNALPLQYKTFIVLRFLKDFSYEEIAQTTNVPVTTVRNRIHQGKQILKELFQKEGVVAPTEDGYDLI